ncbi:MAG: pyruvate ferredoxin oxidoreductase [Candidatus Diapherotrites archaeon]|nr:pyruvate ferredoxin oxidoreductase [Candidatus Diapherotrites archaeon]
MSELSSKERNLTVSGSNAAARSALMCRPEVVAAYPITPTTHVAEKMARYYADGKLKKFIPVEAEFSAISALVGATAAGSRSFSVTGGQGLLLMHEVLHAAAGMRLPLVMLVGNRAVSAPLNIWNDEQDTISQRDVGWIQLYAKSNQEVVDLMPQAFFIAEKTLIPVMVCVDGFFLTHAVEQIIIPSQKQVDDFLPKFKLKDKLDSKNPISLGVYAGPEHYQLFREDLQNDFFNSMKVIEEASDKWKKISGRGYGLTDEFKCSDAEKIIVSLGSMTLNAIAVAKELRSKGEKVGVLHIRSYRPFPREKIKKILAGKKIGVIDRAISLGAEAPLYVEVSEALQGTNSIISSFYGGLGGRSITRKEFTELFKKLDSVKPIKKWIGYDGFEGVKLNE